MIVWNNLPLPPVTDDERAAIAEAGQAVLVARALHPERSLEQHYNPLSMNPELAKAHRDLDRLVGKSKTPKR